MLAAGHCGVKDGAWIWIARKVIGRVLVGQGGLEEGEFGGDRVFTSSAMESGVERTISESSRWWKELYPEGNA